MNYYYALLALELAKERSADADRARMAALFANGQPKRPSVVRRGLAHGLAAVSRGSAAAVRRLDDCIADDLGRSLAPTE
ncbi:MAG: hypothetical protein M3R05_04630 [Chloroflexota bacterium]|nr:hypothetical protein [Chloroflexota bacterium]